MIIGVSGKIGSGKDTVGSVIKYLVYNKNRVDKGFIPISSFNQFNDGYPRETDWKIVKYADKLKDIVCILLGCTREQLEDREFKETKLGEEWTKYSKANGFWSHSDNNPSHKMMDSVQCDKETYEAEFRINWQTAYKTEYTPRQLLQYIGTDLFRKLIHENVWVNATLNNYDYIQKWIAVGSEAVLPNYIITDVRFPNEADAIKQRKGINIRINKNDAAQFGFEKHLELADKINNTKEHLSETSLDDYSFDYVVQHGTIENLIEQVKQILIKENII